jgi:hypothetical protein
MTFPALAPTARSFDPGNWPIKTFKARSGSEVRILYGSARTDLQLELSYDNITDSQAQQFLTHYDQTIGTLRTFQLPEQVRTGWTGTNASLDARSPQAWRYSESPKVTAIRPNRSSVKVNLIGVI